MTQGFNCKKWNPDLLNELGALINGGHLEEQLELAKECPTKKKRDGHCVRAVFQHFFEKHTVLPIVDGKSSWCRDRWQDASERGPTIHHGRPA